MSVFAAVLDFRAPPESGSATALLSGIADTALEPVRCVARGPVAMAVRMHRITPESIGEVQPQDRQDVLLVADCRLDNRDELIRDLGVEANRSDADLLVAAYRRWGEGILTRLRGAYAIALFDARNDSVLAFVDRTSQKRLFYRRIGSRWYFSSQLVRLRRQLAASTSLSRSWAANYLVRAGHLLWEPRDTTLFSEIRQLGWGQALRLRHDGGGVFCYHSIEEELTRPKIVAGGDDIIAETTRLLRQAVQRCLRVQGRADCHLSGGLDSSAIATVAQSLLPDGERLGCLHYRPQFEGHLTAQAQRRVQSEDARIAAIASHFPQLDIRRLDRTGWNLMRTLRAGLDLADMPLVNAGNQAYFCQMAEDAAARNRRVVLSGAFGNFTLSLTDAPGPAPWWSHVRESVRFPFSPRARQSHCRRRWLTPEGDRLLHRRHWPPQGTLQQRLLATFMAAKGLDLEALFKNAFGVEHWLPLADYDLARFTWSLPADAFRRSGKRRLLVSEVLAPLLPPLALDQRVRGIQSPDEFDWYARDVDEVRGLIDSAPEPIGCPWKGADIRRFLALPVERQREQGDLLAVLLGSLSLYAMNVPFDA